MIVSIDTTDEKSAGHALCWPVSLIYTVCGHHTKRVQLYATIVQSFLVAFFEGHRQGLALFLGTQ